MDTAKLNAICTTSWILYAVSALGILTLFTSTHLFHSHALLAIPDFIAYSSLLLFAYLINRGLQIAKLFYAIIAFIWYTALIFFLPSNFHHPLNPAAITAQIALTVTALCLSYSWS
ncbi:MAG: hypothetical protein GY821_07000 [Gammaproteobacteria bacterium]|nr:hypothetical protein [Gammaproteobacteria bacterium]MCP4474302.1 hypothetical protein [Gammaproteobacteria bacterium]